MFKSAVRAGHDTPALTDDQIWTARGTPYGPDTLADIARGRRQAVILFKDLTRPTLASAHPSFVLEAWKRPDSTTIVFCCRCLRKSRSHVPREFFQEAR